MCFYEYDGALSNYSFRQPSGRVALFSRCFPLMRFSAPLFFLNLYIFFCFTLWAVWVSGQVFKDVFAVRHLSRAPQKSCYLSVLQVLFLLFFFSFFFFFFFLPFLFCPWCRFWHQVDELSTSVPSLFNFILYKDCIEKECQCDRWPQSIIKRLQVKSQGWAMCLCGAQLSSPHYLRHSERWIRALRHSLSYQLTRGGEEEMGRSGVSPGLGCPQLLYVCLISQYINQAWLSGEPSAPAIHQDLSASHHNWEMRLWHWNSISPIRLGPTA